MPGLSDVRTLVPSGVEIGPGWGQHFAVPDPAAGAPIVTRAIGGDLWERVTMARATFTADATVATRNPRFEFVGPDGFVYYATPISTGIVAGAVVTINIAIDGAISLAAAGLSLQRMPFNLLQSGWAVRFAADSIGPADAWTGVRFYVIRYPTDIVNVGAGG